MSRGSTPEADSKRNTTSPPSVATRPKSPKSQLKSLPESQVVATLVKTQSIPQEKEELKAEVEKPENERNITKGKILL